MQYTKRDWRNRNKIKTPNGLQWLTIPVEVKGKYLQKINETLISDKNWNIIHWNVIKQNYSKAIFFKENKEFVEDLYLGCKEIFLSQINYHFLTRFCELLEIKTKFTWSSQFELKGDKSEKLLNICLDSKSSEYYSGPAAKDYLDVNLFQQNQVKVNWLNYSDYNEYDQIYPPFEHGVSIIDLLFNTGKDATKFMKSFKNE
jgi:hypothetical protein